MELVRNGRVNLDRIKSVLITAQQKAWGEGAIYKALRDFINNREYLKLHEKIFFAEEIVRATSDRNIYREIVSYIVDIMGYLNGLEERLTMKSMLRFPINMKVFFINLFLEL